MYSYTKLIIPPPPMGFAVVSPSPSPIGVQFVVWCHFIPQLSQLNTTTL